MKKLLHYTSMLFCALLLCLCISPQTVQASASGTTTVGIDLQYGQTEARKMLQMINSFRTSPTDAWFWQEDNVNKTTFNTQQDQKLSELQYDYRLEQTAMQRAAEIALSFSHTRPNGQDYATAYSSNFLNHNNGENIAAGQSSASAVFESWQETRENYAGQGHRRNMLSNDYNVVGIGHVVYNGTHYWVQEFAQVPSPNTSQTTAKDNRETVSVDVLSSNISNVSLSSGIQTITLKPGETAKLPQPNITAQLKDHYPSHAACPINLQGNSQAAALQWITSNANIADITSDGYIRANAAGRASVSASWNGATITCEVAVSSNSNYWPGTGYWPNTGYYPNYTQGEYTIYFNPANGILRENNIQTTVGQRLSWLPTPTRDGYSFSGWYTQPSGGTMVTTSTVFYANTEIYAQWNSVNTGFRDFIISDVTDTTATITAIIPSSQVTNWGVAYGTSTSNLQESRLLSQFAVTSALVTTLTGLTPGTTYYYKVFYYPDTRRMESGIGSFTTSKAAEYTVTFFANGGTLTGQESILTVNQKLPTLPSAYRQDYTFDGWYTEAYSGTRITTDTVIRSATPAYAHWTYSPGAATNPGGSTTNGTSGSGTTSGNGSQNGNGNNGSSNTDFTVDTDYEEPEDPEPVSVQKIKLKSVKNTGKGKIKAAWTWYPYGDGYQIAYSTSKNFASAQTKRKSAGVFTDSKTISGLKKGKTYYVRVRAFQKSDGEKFYGAWSNVKKIKTKK